MKFKTLKSLFCGKLLAGTFLGVVLSMGAFCSAYTVSVRVLLDSDNFDRATGTLKIPNGATEIESSWNSKSRWNNEDKVLSRIRKVIIPSSVKTIGESAFYGCSSLKEITISSSVKTIGRSVFSGCRSLTKVNLSSDTEIDSSVFNNCSKIIELHYPPNDPLAPFLNGHYLVKVLGVYQLV